MKTKIAALAAGLTALAGAAQAQSLPRCTVMPTGVAEHACHCPAGDASGSVWGSGPYTSDSSICAAAVHAGAVGPGGGDVTVRIEPGRGEYGASARNGVSTGAWGPYHSSIVPARLVRDVCGAFPQGAARHSCGCPADAPVRSVWGSGPYTADSDLCSAARHAGAIGERGGRITAYGLPGLEGYAASSRNGVDSADWGAYGASFAIDRNGNAAKGY